MKKAISFLNSPMNFLKRWVGVAAPSSTSQSSATGSCCVKSSQAILQKLTLLAEENHRLKEEIRLLKASKDKTHDV